MARLDVEDHGPMHSLVGRRIVLTGSGGGIGRATALHFADLGARLVLTDVNETTLAATTVDIRERGGEAESRAGDITDERFVRDLVDFAATELDGLDALINVAGVQVAKPLVEQTKAEFDLVMAINLWSCIITTRYAIPHFERAGVGAIVNVASVGGSVSTPNAGIYNASNAAVISITRQFALEHVPSIRANAVCPGAVSTPMLEQHISGFPTREEGIAALTGQQLLPRPADPTEIGRVIAFLASDRASFMTGAVVAVDGGWTVR